MGGGDKMACFCSNSIADKNKVTVWFYVFKFIVKPLYLDSHYSIFFSIMIQYVNLALIIIELLNSFCIENYSLQRENYTILYSQFFVFHT